MFHSNCTEFFLHTKRTKPASVDLAPWKHNATAQRGKQRLLGQGGGARDQRKRAGWGPPLNHRALQRLQPGDVAVCGPPGSPCVVPRQQAVPMRVIDGDHGNHGS